jgi:hypothetical protein
MAGDDIGRRVWVIDGDSGLAFDVFSGPVRRLVSSGF